MIGVADTSVRSSLLPAITTDAPTHVELTWIENKIEFWIRFGREAAEQILDRRRRVVSFAPDSVFAFVRWTSNDYGTALSRLDIVRAVRTGERCQTLPFVRPGGDILLRADGWPKVERVLQLIDAIEARDIDATDVSPDHWRHVHNRLTVGEAPRAYDMQQHRAFLLRREIGA
ncbi:MULTISPECIES: DUF2840 domain-containing protein [Pseudomonadota]|jgi:hypothetical protein|uniref:DUF2840 domain-containing protein n=1 Tax=Pseudomonadota TaxID=1224 RepID=UPI00124F53D9|nr:MULTISPECIES: DUF2840 domain-containing protein [Alphaproteobacteria]KAB2777884.1 DUF2840 domain-containing protein [Brucella anthropi]MBN9032243.1 DUF2840 domain-containing protein [Hyphomicrobiales bacterium]QDD95207.1 Hypothetical protein HVIM_02063 [Roseomonas mucosa]